MNEKPKFTPGPWRFWRHVNEKYPEMSQTAVFGTGDKKFVMIAQTHDDAAAAPEQTIEEIIANARLISAAPEMYDTLAACESSLDIVLKDVIIPEYIKEIVQDIILTISHTLKKARGEK